MAGTSHPALHGHRYTTSTDVTTPTTPVVTKPGQFHLSTASAQYSFSALPTGNESVRLVYEVSAVVDEGPLAAAGLRFALEITLDGSREWKGVAGPVPGLEHLTPFGILTPPYSPPAHADDPKIDPGPEKLPPWLARLTE